MYQPRQNLLSSIGFEQPLDIIPGNNMGPNNAMSNNNSSMNSNNSAGNNSNPNLASRQRLRWTNELHERFVDAVTQLGGPDRKFLTILILFCFACLIKHCIFLGHLQNAVEIYRKFSSLCFLKLH
jgi:SHAQKYF class myb-like DNA-binding protein